jgi:drug/metabolite transporter (DMT)-like permease
MKSLQSTIAFGLLAVQSAAFIPSSSLARNGGLSRYVRPTGSETNIGLRMVFDTFQKTKEIVSSTTDRSQPVFNPMGDLTEQLEPESVETISSADDEYRKGFLIISFITFLNASTNPLWHAAYGGEGALSPLLLNAMLSVVALIGLVAGGPLLDSSAPTMSNLAQGGSEEDAKEAMFMNFRGGAELGVWKFLGTTCHLYGLSLTTANHGAFLIQLTTLIVPVIEGLQGEKIPRQIQLAVGVALGGIFAFTQDPTGAATTAEMASQQALGDALCVACAFFYSFYDIQTFKWGKIVPRKELVTTKVGTQAALSCALLAATQWGETADLFASSSSDTMTTLVPVVLWSGLIVNALATFLQVGGMQAVGPTRAQTIFASQPLWSAGLAYAFLGETVGLQGAVGGSFFLFALFLAATAPKESAPTEADAEA